MLATPAVDVWVATASPSNVPHLVPLSLAWIDERAVIAVEGGSVTARNLSASGRARLAIGPTRDVVMIDATLEATLAVEADTALAAAYVSQADWDPRLSAPGAAGDRPRSLWRDAGFQMIIWPTKACHQPSDRRNPAGVVVDCDGRRPSDAGLCP